MTRPDIRFAVPPEASRRDTVAAYRASRMARAMGRYAECMRWAAAAEKARDSRSARGHRADALAQLHDYPNLQKEMTQQ